MVHQMVDPHRFLINDRFKGICRPRGVFVNSIPGSFVSK